VKTFSCESCAESGWAGGRWDYPNSVLQRPS